MTDGVVPGRTRISERALTRVVSAVTATTLAVPHDDVRVTLSDRSGQLSAEIRTPVDVSGGPVLQQVAALQDRVRAQVPVLTARTVGHVQVRVTAATTTPRRRLA